MFWSNVYYRAPVDEDKRMHTEKRGIQGIFCQGVSKPSRLKEEIPEKGTISLLLLV